MADSGGARRTFIVLLTTLAALDLLIMAARVASVLHFGDVPRLASEGPVLYSIWKIRHGYPLYEPPFTPAFAVTLYNFLSYQFYAAALRVFHVADAATPLAARGVTAAFAVAGGILQYLAARELLRQVPHSRGLLAVIAIVTWAGAVLPGAWTLAIRPDVGAVALDLAGVYCVLRGLRDHRHVPFLLAGALFFAAWAFKQSHIVAAAATTAYLLVWRHWMRAALLTAAPFAAGVALSLALGGPVYRENILDAPALSPLLGLYAWFGVRTVALPELLFWMAAAIAMLALLARPGDMAGASTRGFGVDVVYPAMLTAAAGVAAVVMLAKAGSAINHAIELKACAALVLAGIVGGVPSRPRATYVTASALTIVMLASHISRASAERDVLVSGVTGSDPSAASRRAAVALVAALPRPLYAEDELYALPWIANGNQYPAVIPDYQVYQAAKDAGVLTDTIDAMVERRAFASLVLPDTSPLVPLARAAGYRVVDTVPQIRDRPITMLRRPADPRTR